jgi:hypothetical protein
MKFREISKDKRNKTQASTLKVGAFLLRSLTGASLKLVNVSQKGDIEKQTNICIGQKFTPGIKA